MSVNIWGTVSGVAYALPMTSLLGTSGQLLGMTSAADMLEYKAVTFLNNQLAVPVGSVGAPSYSFTGDTNTGLYQPTADQIAVAAGGVQGVVWSSTVATHSLTQVMNQKNFQADQAPQITVTGSGNVAIPLGSLAGNLVKVDTSGVAPIVTSITSSGMQAGTEIEIIVVPPTLVFFANSPSLEMASGVTYFTAVQNSVVRFRKTNDASDHWQLTNYQAAPFTPVPGAKGSLIVSKEPGGGTREFASSPSLTDKTTLIGDPSVSTGVKLASPFRRNFAINGMARVWQRGTSFVAAADQSYSADMWKYLKSGAMVHTISRSTDVPSVAVAGVALPYSVKFDCTTADATIGATDLCAVEIPIEGVDWKLLSEQALAISFCIKTTVGGWYGVSVGGVDRRYVTEVLLNSNTWERKTVLIPASPTAGTWDYANGIGATVRITFAAGANYQVVPGSWLTTTGWSASAAATQANGVSSTANDIFITGLQVEVGPNSTPIEDVPFAEDLRRCQRYYEKTFPYDTAPAQAVGSFQDALFAMVPIGDTLASFSWHFKTEKRGAPSITTYNPTQANAFARNWGNTVDTTLVQLSPGSQGTKSVGFYFGNGTAQYPFGVHAVADASL